ncbi:MAG TPA: hypothetical protein VFZ69_07115 [Longimicrobiales bacterium]
MGAAREDVAAAARLARLTFNEVELDAVMADLAAMLERIDELRHVPGAADPVEPDAVPPGIRADEPGADPLHVPLSRIASGWRSGCFTVPRIRGREPDA